MDEDEYEGLFLANQQWLIEAFKCNYNASLFFGRGTLFITRDVIFFASGSFKNAIYIRQIRSIEKESKMIVSQGIKLEMEPESSQQDSYFFGSVSHLDSCFALLDHLHKYREGGAYDRYRRRTLIATYPINPALREQLASVRPRSAESNAARAELLGSWGASRGPEPSTAEEKTGAANLSSLERSLRYADESRQLATQTLQTLAQQTEQIERTRAHLSNVNYNLSVSNKLLKSMSSLAGTFRAYFSKDPRKEDFRVRSSSDSAANPSAAAAAAAAGSGTLLSSAEASAMRNQFDALLVDGGHTFRPVFLQQLQDGVSVVDPETVEQLQTAYFERIIEVAVHARPFSFTIRRTDGDDVGPLMSIRYLDILQMLRNCVGTRLRFVKKRADWIPPDLGIPDARPDVMSTATVSEDGGSSEGSSRRRRKEAQRAIVSEAVSNNEQQRQQQQSSLRQAQQMQEDQDLDELSVYLAELKQQALVIGDTVQHQNKVLDEVNDEMDRTQYRFERSNRKINKMLS